MLWATAPGSPPVLWPTRYGSAHYGQDAYASASPTWQVPDGYNDVDLAPSYKDRQGQETLFGYDVEGNRINVTRPGGSNAPVTTATYDVVNRLAAIDTVRGTTDLLPMSYGYDPASNRVGHGGGRRHFRLRGGRCRPVDRGVHQPLRPAAL